MEKKKTQEKIKKIKCEILKEDGEIMETFTKIVCEKNVKQEGTERGKFFQVKRGFKNKRENNYSLISV